MTRVSLGNPLGVSFLTISFSGRLFKEKLEGNSTNTNGCGSKLNRRGYVVLVHVSTCQGTIFGTGFWSHSQVGHMHLLIAVFVEHSPWAGSQDVFAVQLGFTS